MPERKNRTRRSMLWVCALAVMVLLAALPATAAWYATQSAAGGSAIETASFNVTEDTEKKRPSVSLDLAELKAEYETVWDTVKVADALYYDTTVVTVTADEKNTASGYVIVTYNNKKYYSDFIAPGESVRFTVPGGEVGGSGDSLAVSGEDASGETYSNEFVIEAGWGRPEEGLTLEKLQKALDAQTAGLVALQKETYLKELAAQLEQAKQAAEEAARKAAEEAANQAGQNTGAATTEPTGVFTGS